ncbi:MAG: metallophosphoesterase family protein [Bacteroidota bacterium]
MTIAIISDIHSNLEALTVVLNEIERLKIRQVYCLGDVVGYGANPNECIHLLWERNIPCVAGNHDKAAIKEIDIDDFSDAARSGIAWTRSVLTHESIQYLKSLPLSLVEHGIMFVHSSPDEPQEFRYLIYPEDTLFSYKAFSVPLCVVGHTHRPVVFCEDMVSTHIVRDKKFIVNAGSVGQPRDGNWRACFMLVDTDAWSIEYVRLEYDVKTAREKILAAGLPKKLGDRLLVGI